MYKKRWYTMDWSTKHSRKLIVLGFATELLDVYLNVPREKWEKIFGSTMSIVIKNNEIEISKQRFFFYKK